MLCDKCRYYVPNKIGTLCDRYNPQYAVCTTNPVLSVRYCVYYIPTDEGQIRYQSVKSFSPGLRRALL